MTLIECKEIIGYIASAFPRFYSSMTRQSYEQQARVWTDILGEYSYQDVHAGTQGYISSDASGFPPSPGQIVEYIHKIRYPRDRNGPEAWALVRRAVRSSGWDAAAAYNTLPPLVQRAVGSAESLRAMALMDIDRFESVAQSNFLRTYEAMVRREAIERRMPQAARAMIEGLEPKPLIQKPMEDPPKLEARNTVPAPGGMVEKLRSRLGVE